MTVPVKLRAQVCVVHAGQVVMQPMLEILQDMVSVVSPVVNGMT